MIALAFLAMSGGTTAVLVVASALAAFVAWLRRRKFRSSAVAPLQGIAAARVAVKGEVSAT